VKHFTSNRIFKICGRQRKAPLKCRGDAAEGKEAESTTSQIARAKSLSGLVVEIQDLQTCCVDGLKNNP
jgi:hypothetical protein